MCHLGAENTLSMLCVIIISSHSYSECLLVYFIGSHYSTCLKISFLVIMDLIPFDFPGTYHMLQFPMVGQLLAKFLLF